MRALVCHAYGPIESLKIEDAPTPEPKAGEVLIRVGAAGVSFAAMLGVEGKHQNKPALPYIPGNELAGHVVALGAGVDTLKVGDRIATGVPQGQHFPFTFPSGPGPFPNFKFGSLMPLYLILTHNSGHDVTMRSARSPRSRKKIRL